MVDLCCGSLSCQVIRIFWVVLCCLGKVLVSCGLSGIVVYLRWVDQSGWRTLRSVLPLIWSALLDLLSCMFPFHTGVVLQPFCIDMSQIVPAVQKLLHWNWLSSFGLHFKMESWWTKKAAPYSKKGIGCWLKKEEIHENSLEFEEPCWWESLECWQRTKLNRC